MFRNKEIFSEIKNFLVVTICATKVKAVIGK